MLVIGDSGGIVKENASDTLFQRRIYEQIKIDYGAIRFINKAHNALTSEGMVQNIPFWRHLEPDLIICTIGANDAVDNTGTEGSPGTPAVTVANMETNLATIYNVFKEMNPNTGIMFCSPWHANLEEGGQKRPNAASYRTAIENFCTSKSLTCALLHTVWGESEWGTYTYDNIHPNEAGSAKLFDYAYPLVTNTIGKDWLKTFK